MSLLRRIGPMLLEGIIDAALLFDRFVSSLTPLAYELRDVDRRLTSLESEEREATKWRAAMEAGTSSEVGQLQLRIAKLEELNTSALMQRVAQLENLIFSAAEHGHEEEEAEENDSAEQ